MAGSTWTWLGLTNDPSLSSNWTPTGVPQSGDILVFTGAGVTPQFLDNLTNKSGTFELKSNGTLQFSNDTTAASNSGLNASSVIDAIGTPTTLSIAGPFTNYGTIEVTGTVTGNSLAIAIGANDTITGDFVNYGEILVAQGESLSISATGGATFSDPGTVVVAGGSASVDASLIGPDNFSISGGGSLELKNTGSTASPNVTFNGAGTLTLQPGFSGSINGFALGDTIDLGALSIATVTTDGYGMFTAINSGGTTVFTAYSNNGPLNGNVLTTVLSGASGIAGDVQITQGGTGDTVITGLQPATWLWIGGTARGDTPGAWSWVSGPVNGFNSPQQGDSAIVTNGTILFGTNPQLTSNTIHLGGTAGTVAALSGVGDSSTTFMSPSLDQNSTITSAMPTVGTFVPSGSLEASLLSAGGMFINEGKIVADGVAGSSFTIAISSGGTVNGTLQPGYFINSNKIEVDTGNSMTITVAGTSELINVGEILVNGGSLSFSADTNAIAGGYAPGSGVVVIMRGGTVETNVGYASNITGSTPVYAFGDSTGNTLKIDNIGSFGGAILGFGQNDTIDLGTLLAVGTIAYSSSTGILKLENSSGTVLDSLLLGSGNFLNGTSAVVGGVAGRFTVGTGVDGNTVLTTSVQNHFITTSGDWQTGSWVNGVPGTLDSVLIGLGATSPFTLTTGSTAVSVGALTLASDKALLEITSNTTSTAYAIRDFGGTLEVMSGHTLTASALNVNGGTTVVDQTALLDLTGHVVYGGVGATNGTISTSSGNTNAVQVASGALLVSGGTLNAGTGQGGTITGGKIYIGFEGNGTPATMTVQNSGTNAGVVTDTYALVASDPTSFGALTLNGNGSSGGALWTDQIDPNDTVTTRGYMDIGYNSQVGNDTLIGSSGNNTLYGGSGNDSIYGDAGTAMLVVENGATLTEQTYARIANTVDSAGSVLVSNALWNIGASVLGGFLNVGQIGAGALTVSQGGTVQVDNGTGSLVVGSTTLQSNTFLSTNNGTTTPFTGSGINVGLSAGARGTLTVSGANSLVTDAAGINVGNAGQGLVQILNGGTIQLTGTNGINVGKSGQGTLDVESGGTIQMNGAGGIGVGQTFGATGLVIVNGSNALINEGTASGGMGVGQAGTGTLEVTNGGTISLNGTSAGSGLGVGQTFGATGLVLVAGGNAGNALLSVNGVASGVNIGQYGQGTLEVQAGGTVSIAGSGGLHIGTGSGGGGTVTVSGVGALITTSGVSVGGAGTGSLTIGTGGTVQAQSLWTRGSIVLAGGNLVDLGAATTSGTISGFGTFTGSLTNSGTVIATGGTLDFTGGLSGTGGITIVGGAALQSEGLIGQSVTFATSPSPEFLILGSVASTSNFAISNWQYGDEIVFTNRAFTNGATVTDVQWLSGTLAVTTSSSGTFDFTNVGLADAGTTPIFNWGTNTTGANFVELVSCFAAGTRIATERGPVKVEDLKEGDLVHTVIDGRPAPIVWIGHREVNCARHPQPKTVWPMHVRANAFGPGLPERDLTLSPDHAVYVNDVLIPVKHLENGSSIVQVPVDRVTYYHVELPRHDVVLAEGLPAESYLDVGDKSNFANGGGPVALFPDFIALKWEAEGCAPLVITGPEFDSVRQMLAGWAEKAVATTRSPKRTRQRHKRV